MKPTERFSNRAEDYRRYRPGYPAAVAELIRDTCGLGNGAHVADIGAGTGIFTRVLLEAGFDVTAVEPNAAMRAALEEELGGFAGLHPVDAPAEETGLPEGTFDAITVAQAFHWFDHAAARKEFRRVLRADGWVFIVRNHRREETTPLARDYVEMMRLLRERFRAAAQHDEKARERAVEEFFPEGALRTARFDNPHTMDWEGLRGMFLSMSVVPVAGEPGHEELMSRLKEIFDAHAEEGRVVFEQVTEVYYGRLGG